MSPREMRSEGSLAGDPSKLAPHCYQITCWALTLAFRVIDTLQGRFRREF